MKCPKCKKKIDKNNAFCIYCGEKVNKKSKLFLKDYEENDSGKTSKAMKSQISCRTCKKIIPDNSKFCPYCGLLGTK